MRRKECPEAYYDFVNLLVERERVLEGRLRSVSAPRRREGKAPGYTVNFENGKRVRVPAYLVENYPGAAFRWVEGARQKRKGASSPSRQTVSHKRRAK